MMIVVVEDEFQRFSRFWLPLEQIFDVRLLIKQNFIAGVGHRHVKKHIVVYCKSHECSHKLKVDVWLESLTVEPVELDIFVKFEHSILRIEKLLHNQTEILLHHATHIDARLVFKLCF